ncbi:hypothetical protein [Vagococcus sp.]|uniref:hypothetical protein n=1 Tax=Vagococcus sp. TaxID=1933889 RepID=UPI003F9B0A21
MIEKYKDAKIFAFLEKSPKFLFFVGLILIIGLINWKLTNIIAAKRFVLFLLYQLTTTYVVSFFKIKINYFIPVCFIITLLINFILFSIFYTHLNLYYLLAISIMTLFQNIIMLGFIMIFKANQLVKLSSSNQKTKRRIKTRVKSRK